MTDLESANFLVWLARNPKNERVKARLECAAAHLIDNREDLNEAHVKIKTLEQKIHTLEQELLKAMRTFVDATKVVLDHDVAVAAANGTLTDANKKLADDLAAAQANASTPEVLAAQAQIIDRAEVISPSAPPQ